MPLYDEFPLGVLSPGFLDPYKTEDRPRQDRFAVQALEQGPVASPMDNPGLMAAIGDVGPDPKSVKGPGLMGRIRQQPGGSKALIALGASLLSNPNFFQGLGEGAMAYQNTLDSEAEKLLPQQTKDNTFTYQRDPQTGQLIFNRTPVADYEEGIQDMKLKAAFAQAKMRDEGDTARLETTMGYRDKWEANDAELQREELGFRDKWNQRDNEYDLQIARVNAENSWREANLRVNNTEGKPPPAAVQKQIGDYTSTRDAQINAQSQLAPLISAIERGDLSFSLPSNLRHKTAIATGMGGNEETVWFSQYQTSLESLRNALLVANKGVQTDGDAERAMAELIAGSGNTETVLANLRKVYGALSTRGSQAQARIDELARQYGADVSSSSPAASRPQPRRTTGSTNGVRWRIVN